MRPNPPAGERSPKEHRRSCGRSQSRACRFNLLACQDVARNWLKRRNLDTSLKSGFSRIYVKCSLAAVDQGVKKACEKCRGSVPRGPARLLRGLGPVEAKKQQIWRESSAALATSEEVCPHPSRRIQRSRSDPSKGLSLSQAGLRKKSVPIPADRSSGAGATQAKDCPYLRPVLGRSLSPSQPTDPAEPERPEKRTVPISGRSSEGVCPHLSRRIQRSQSGPRKGLSLSQAGLRKKSVPIPADRSSGARATREKDCPYLRPDFGRSLSPSQPTDPAEPERLRKRTVPISLVPRSALPPLSKMGNFPCPQCLKTSSVSLESGCRKRLSPSRALPASASPSCPQGEHHLFSGREDRLRSRWNDRIQPNRRRGAPRRGAGNGRDRSDRTRRCRRVGEDAPAAHALSPGGASVRDRLNRLFEQA